MYINVYIPSAAAETEPESERPLRAPPASPGGRRNYMYIYNNLCNISNSYNISI